MLFLSSADFFQNEGFQEILSGIQSECQTVWIQIRTDILSVLIWVQTVCKGYQQMTKVAASLERVKFLKPSKKGRCVVRKSQENRIHVIRHTCISSYCCNFYIL